ncbi:hypothetical protein JCM17961_14850 [Endothiovibrio diazotrophicus]
MVEWFSVGLVSFSDIARFPTGTCSHYELTQARYPPLDDQRLVSIFPIKEKEYATRRTRSADPERQSRGGRRIGLQRSRKALDRALTTGFER